MRTTQTKRRADGSSVKCLNNRRGRTLHRWWRLSEATARGLVRSSRPWPVWTNVHRDLKPCSDVAVQSTRTSLSPGSEMHRWPSRKMELLRMWSTSLAPVCVCADIYKWAHAYMWVYLLARVYTRPPRPAPAIDTLCVKHAWVTSYRKEEMRGFRLWHVGCI